MPLAQVSPTAGNGGHSDPRRAHHDSAAAGVVTLFPRAPTRNRDCRNRSGKRLDRRTKAGTIGVRGRGMGGGGPQDECLTSLPRSGPRAPVREKRVDEGRNSHYVPAATASKARATLVQATLPNSPSCPTGSISGPGPVGSVRIVSRVAFIKGRSARPQTRRTCVREQRLQSASQDGVL